MMIPMHFSHGVVGVAAFFSVTIGRWKSWCACSRNCMQKKMHFASDDAARGCMMVGHDGGQHQEEEMVGVDGGQLLDRQEIDSSRLTTWGTSMLILLVRGN
jgi:hypothetical protein